MFINVGRERSEDLPRLRVDSKHRVVLETGLRRTSGIERGDVLTAVAFQGGIILTSTMGEKFAESLRGFGFEEGKHEATKYVLSRRDSEARKNARP